MMLRSLTLALLASMVMAETVPAGVPTPIETEEAERTEKDWEEDEDDSDIVECTLILLLDDKPSETAWEVRGPLPGVSVAGSAAYDFYEGMEVSALGSRDKEIELDTSVSQPKQECGRKYVLNFYHDPFICTVKLV